SKSNSLLKKVLSQVERIRGWKYIKKHQNIPTSEALGFKLMEEFSIKCHGKLCLESRYETSFSLANHQHLCPEIIDGHVRKLDFHDHKLPNFDIAYFFPEVTDIEIQGNNCYQDAYDGLYKFRKLKHLDISVGLTSLSQIKDLTRLNNLEILFIGYAGIKEINSLTNLKNLKKLTIYDNLIEEIKGLESLESLEVLSLSPNRINEIKGLDTLKNLKILDLSNNNISEIKGLENLSNLESLNLSNNLIREIKGLDALENLKVLNLSSNFIKTFEWTQELTNLEELDLYDNNLNPNLEKSELEIKKKYNFKHFSCSNRNDPVECRKDFLDAYNERIHNLRKKMSYKEKLMRFGITL
ncbi:MAG: leucine-rich repeat domain-containing protein, partial [Candidatus Lokiarchaeota archaeon]